MAHVVKSKGLLLGAGFALALGSGVTGPAAADSVDRLIAQAETYMGQIDVAELRQACGGKVRCAAERIAASLGDAARLEPTAQPTTDTIRWVETTASLGAVKDLPNQHRLIELKRFGRKVEPDLRRALELGGAAVVLDLRGNAGGDFGRMLRVASLLIGPRAGAVTLTHRNRQEHLDLPRVPSETRPRRISVLVGPGTASSAEVLAALLRRHAGAEILGTRTAGKDYLLRVIPVDQTMRLLIPAERIEVPGETLAGGLRPDGPVSPGLLAALSP